MLDEQNTEKFLNDLLVLRNQTARMEAIRTEYRRAQNALRESEQFSSSLLTNSPNPIVVINPDTTIKYVNPSLEILTGFSSVELVGRKAPYPWWLKEKVEQTSKGLRKTLQEGIKREEIFQTKNGDPFWVEITSRMVRIDGELKYYLSNWVDITERKQAEEALKRQILRNDLILQTAMDGFYILDVDGNVLETNNAASKILGYEREEIIGLNLQVLNVQEDSSYSWKHIKKELIKNGSYLFQVRQRRKDGGIVYLEFSTNFVHMGEDCFLFCFFRDITDRKQTERALKQRERELQIKTANLEKANTALEVLLEKRESDRRKLEEKVVSNINELVMPYLEKLQKNGLNESQKQNLLISKSNLNNIVSAFSLKLSSKYFGLTPAEIQVANLVKYGRTTKEIAESLNLAVETIDSHRKHIRKKLGISNKKVNLRTHLLSIP